jgi:fumarylpyruvate hydrolase
MSLLFNIETPTVGIRDSLKRFPVNRIYCVGRNYAAHAREMGGNPDRESPFFFSKPANAVIDSGAILSYPLRTQELHHEVELVVALAGAALERKGEQLSLSEATAAIFGYATGIDFTRRDLQTAAKDKGRPWDTAKGFDASAPVSALTPVELAGNINSATISLRVNGEIRQQGHINDLIWQVPELIAELSTYYRLRPGDLIFTGTPAGVDAVQPGDRLEGVIDGLLPIQLQIIERS